MVAKLRIVNLSNRYLLGLFLSWTFTFVNAQVVRSESFHNRYSLKKVVVLSRHGIRSPISGPTSALSRITPHQWHKWSSAPGELSLRGGILETMMGQYFRKWLVSKGVITENHLPADGEFRFYANSLQRAIATARYFSAGLLPVSPIAVEYHYDIDRWDPVFTPVLTKVDGTFQRLAMEQVDSIIQVRGAISAGEYLRENYALLENVLDINQSAACVQGDTCGFRTDDTRFSFVEGKWPGLSGTLTLAATAADALVLQYYEESNEHAAAFGHTLTLDDWEKIAAITNWQEELHYNMPVVAMNVAHPLLKEMLKDLQDDGRLFSFFCGHDVNLRSVLASLRIADYQLPCAIEKNTPVGCKLVLEVWDDVDGREYVAMNLVYQSVEQIRSMKLLSLENPPCCYPLSVKGLQNNGDGLYSFEDIEKRFLYAISAYDTQASGMEDIANNEKASSIDSTNTYNLQGYQITNSPLSGIYIKNGKKLILK